MRAARFLALLCLVAGTGAARTLSALDLAGGAELGFVSVPLLSPDPYSFAASAGLWCEAGGFAAFPLTVGAWAAAAGFRPLSSAYGASTMYYGGFELGYELGLFRGGEVFVGLRPLLRLGWYLRSVTVGGAERWGSRPFISSGALVELKSASLDLGLALLASVPMDNRPVFLLGLLQRIGL
ncbi:MAG TPA: hypothetical protein VMV83_14895 [Rectinemataceae bacterium]|nr:hypothetical protein [Rectinemataceae bacterium]